MYFITKELYFPPVEETSKEGVLAVGGDLSPERLLLAYKNGIFPWFDDNDPILWWCPPQRMVLFPNEFKPSKSMRNVINKGIFKITFNTCFRDVMINCQQIYRPNQYGTWITDEMIDSYTYLHERGKAMSVEVWLGEELVGGLYGVDMNPVFCGESMFSHVSNASKIAFIALVDYLKGNKYKLLDCQIYNDHLASLGCYEIPREDFIALLKEK
ncbi:leucyl/phenylalanyl-tRNA--protein transferase [Flavobacterium columnare NBRC 100251 = ATCC 23463]|uniref:Leucyl/phenylalanyl-tRNA--protein transferase n=2 Tax=Flavobacterium columnare TaxID=996 RepID=G8X9P6_FLACA|nr:leucyl/phenylalanyl-tRNA--protein transferase [Flavobacterium columnare]AEW86609.1 leucyl/phenylalanyl-tRNA--protein transferase [Flavobacterium columnare ATCC 49512]AMO20508.1 leucyl/phenylalanyl-tRNA--protein transferase [Flavobacterium columnare]ANO47016.1 leucyl/phenylalanyl-tRNA--protein transferase [Flavobacterium columnare]APT22286.1 leucyl/phenylalanyl-tRNA--protein transferase [Flavobacterium columnare]AUX18477.1 leucyl/phenylalanyl-tRNA--protein transferase [Flavobacterium columna